MISKIASKIASSPLSERYDYGTEAETFPYSHEDYSLEEWDEISEKIPEVYKLFRSTGIDYPAQDDPVWEDVMKLVEKADIKPASK
jgi:hypothetical protein